MVDPDRWRPTTIQQKKNPYVAGWTNLHFFIQFNTDNFQAHQSHGDIQKYNRLASGQ